MPVGVSVASPSSVEVRSERVSRFPEILFSAIALLLVAVRIVQDHDNFTQRPGVDWGISEWMISYAGGFVRRGLGGSFLAAVIHLSGLGFYPILITLTTAAYLGLCVFLLRISLRLRGPAIWRFVLLLNPILIVCAADYGTISRKDVLFLCATLLNVGLSSRFLARPQENSANASRPVAPLLIASALLALALALLHEGIFTFVWFPLNAAILTYALHRSGRSRRSVALRVLTTLLPAIAAVAASAIWHGDARSAEVICRSWRSAVPVTCDWNSDFPVALGALTWNLRHGLSLSLSYAAWFPLYPVILMLGGSLEILAVRTLVPAARLEHLVSLLLFPFLASLPLYLLGVDWGRWLSLIATCSLFVMLSPSLRPCAYEALPSWVRKALCARLIPMLDRILSWLQPRLQREAVLLGIALILIPVPPIPDRRMMLLDAPYVLISFFVHHVVR